MSINDYKNDEAAQAAWREAAAALANLIGGGK